MKIGIVIVAWNSGPELVACVESLVKDRGSVGGNLDNVSIVVVDNGSTDDSIRIIREKFGGQLELITLQKNEGFARACNFGTQGKLWDYILFLNPDVVTCLADIGRLVDELRKQGREKYAIVGPQLWSRSDQISRCCSRFPSPGNLFFSSIGFGGKWGPRMSDWDHQESRRVDQIMGAVFLIRADVFETLKGFDERFFVYYEEVDVCYRAALQGWLSWYTADVRAVHTGGGSSKNIPSRRVFYVLRSRILYAQKHFAPIARWAVVSTTLLIEPVVRNIWCIAAKWVSCCPGGLRRVATTAQLVYQIECR